MSSPRIDLAQVLAKAPLLADLSPNELQLLATRTVRKLFGSGELLFSEGEPCSGLHIIARGKVRIFKTSVSGREQVLALNGPGDTVAELPVFDGGPYPLLPAQRRMPKSPSFRDGTSTLTVLSIQRWRSRFLRRWERGSAGSSVLSRSCHSRRSVNG